MERTEPKAGKAYLLLWNPAVCGFDDMPRMIRDIANGQQPDDDWSIGSRRYLPEGSLLFLIKTGELPRGIIGQAVSTGAPFKRKGRSTLFVPLRWLSLIDPEETPPLPTESLPVPHLLRGGGVSLAPDAAAVVAAAWADYLKRLGRDLGVSAEALVAKEARSARSKFIHPERGSDWTRHEDQETVAAYFSMLQHELLGHKYVKAEYNRNLQEKLHGVRSRQSIEFKFANISAVLIRLGLPYIKGYQPRSNFQARLRECVEEHVSKFDWGRLLRDAPLLHPHTLPHIERIAFEKPPGKIILPDPVEQRKMSGRAIKIDYTAQEATNRHLGRLGEEWVVNFERQRLIGSGRDDLARKVEWIADTRGDGFGYDVLSFNEHNGSRRTIEVKTTTQGKHFPFYMTKNEIQCSAELKEQYHLYRLFEFGDAAKVYRLQGDMRRVLALEPVLYRASIG